ncbi:hypothetical protein [Caballeronia fortuita]|uniref:hypothetical protein n=1 Tax=Caballeronia fortuita TaxID=1777138 RepID=UPI000772C67D|nr:hypothetical protein [Caballeronia fortuita]
MTVLSDDECSPPWALDLNSPLKRIDAALQMAGIDTTQPLRAPIERSPGDDENDAPRPARPGE